MTNSQTLDSILFALADNKLNEKPDNPNSPIMVIDQNEGYTMEHIFKTLQITAGLSEINLYQTKLINDGYIQLINQNFNPIKITEKGILFIVEKGGYIEQAHIEKESIRRRKLEDKILKINVNTYALSIISIVVTVILSLLTLYFSFFKS